MEGVAVTGTGNVNTVAMVIEKGKTVWVEEPLLLLQTYENRKFCRCCYFCGKFLGTNADMVKSLGRAHRHRGATAVKRSDIWIPCSHGLEKEHIASGCTGSKCKSIYCSAKCRADDIRLHGHAFICTNGGEQSLMAQFFKFAATQQQVVGDENRAQIDYNFIYAAEITAQLICTAKNSCQHTGSMDLVAHLSTAVAEYFAHFYGVGGMEFTKEMPVYHRNASYLPEGLSGVHIEESKRYRRLCTEIEEQCDEAWYLFSSALMLEKRCFELDDAAPDKAIPSVQDVTSVLNADFWVRLLSTVDLYFLPVALESPLVAAAKSLRTLDTAEKRTLYAELTDNRAVDGVVDIANRPVCSFTMAKCSTAETLMGRVCVPGCNICVPGREVYRHGGGGGQFDQSSSQIHLDRAVELLIQQSLYVTTDAEVDTSSDCFSANPFSNPFMKANYVGIALVRSSCGQPVCDTDTNEETCRHVRHSCVPNLSMEAITQEHPFKISCKFSAMRDFGKDDESDYSMSFIPHNDQDAVGRSTQLRRKVHLHNQFGISVPKPGVVTAVASFRGGEALGPNSNSIICRCERCVLECNNNNDASADASGSQDVPLAPDRMLSYANLLGVAYQAMQESRYDEATELLVSMSFKQLAVLTDTAATTEEKNKGFHWVILGAMRDAFHALGACCLEAGFWEQGHVVWALGQRWFRVMQAKCVEVCASAAQSPLLPGHLLDSQCTKDEIYGNILPDLGANAGVCRQESKDILSLDFHHCIMMTQSLSSGAAGDRAGSLWGSKPAEAAPVASPGIYISAIPILSPQECDSIIQAAEDHISATNGGKWFTSRHYSVPTTDIPAHTIPALKESFCRKVVVDLVKPLFLSQYRKLSGAATGAAAITADDVLIHDVFVVKYEASKDGEATQRSLPLHYDQSSHSFVIALSDNCLTEKSVGSCEDGARYSGGGTFFPALCGGGIDVVPNSPERGNNSNTRSSGRLGVNGICAHKGHICTFAGGDVLHSGETVLSGIRYIIAGFVYLRTGTRGGTAVPATGMLPVRDFISKLSAEPSPDMATMFDGVSTMYMPDFRCTMKPSRFNGNPSTVESTDGKAKRPRSGECEQNADAPDAKQPKEFKFSFDDMFTE